MACDTQLMLGIGVGLTIFIGIMEWDDIKHDIRSWWHRKNRKDY